MKTGCITVVVSILLLAAVSESNDRVYNLRKNRDVIGETRTHEVKENESLIEIARKFRLGYNEIVDANPMLDPFIPDAGAPVNIPAEWVLPDMKKYEGIVINLSEMRLYLFLAGGRNVSVRTYPIGIGSEGNDTPAGSFRVMEKIVKPSWHVPESIKKERPELPDVVLPGPDNPLGSHALRLTMNTILIHGTNKPWGIGRRVSHGCIRLYPEDIPKLFQQAPEGATVNIVRQPVKAGIADNTVYIEVHRDVSIKDFNYYNEAVRLLAKKGLLRKVNTEKLYRAIEDKNGMPVRISD